MVLTGLLLVLVSGCGQTADQSNTGTSAKSSDSPPKEKSDNNTTGTSAEPVENQAEKKSDGVDADSGEQAIAISGSAFQPGNLTIKTGNTVVWTNQDGIEHQVHADNEAFQGDPFGQDGVFEIAFSATGTVTYHCHVHPYMKGTIIVE